MANKTTTTTVVHSRKDSDGNWAPYERTVTTVVERDDEGYPYGPLTNAYLGGRYVKDRYRYYGNYRTWYDSLGFRPASKPEQDKKDEQNG